MLISAYFQEVTSRREGRPVKTPVGRSLTSCNEESVALLGLRLWSSHFSWSIRRRDFCTDFDHWPLCEHHSSWLGKEKEKNGNKRNGRDGRTPCPITYKINFWLRPWEQHFGVNDSATATLHYFL